jgi:hypothetical protein
LEVIDIGTEEIAKMDISSLGKGLVAMGALLVVVGGTLWLLGKAGLPLGHLPGDIHIQGKDVSCYLPIVTMIVLSIVLTVVLNIIVRLLNR